MPPLVFHGCQESPTDGEPEKRDKFFKVPQKQGGPGKGDHGMKGQVDHSSFSLGIGGGAVDGIAAGVVAAAAAAARNPTAQRKSHRKMAPPKQNDRQCASDPVRCVHITEEFCRVVR